MKPCSLAFRHRLFPFFKVLRGGCVLLAISMMIVFFSGCESTKSASQSGDNTILREPESGHQIHGEVGAVYGHSG
jgi:ribosomal protein L35AE/L33A